jgi:methylmalonyl-CoA/ethylmalonyl-CoA epimerase
MAQKLDHIGILVSNLDDAIKLYEDCFGAEVDRIETVSEQGVKAVILSLGQGAKLELLEPVPDSNMAKVLEKRGEGLHHITFEVDDVDRELSRLSERGVELIDKKSRRGLEGMVAFIHPKSVRGVLVELCQKI